MRVTLATKDGGTHVDLDPVQDAGTIEAINNERANNGLTLLKSRKSNEIHSEALRRMKARVPALCSMEMIDLMVVLWPTLNTVAAGANLIACRDIYLYAKSKITQVDTATQVQLEAYAPGADLNFPS